MERSGCGALCLFDVAFVGESTAPVGVGAVFYVLCLVSRWDCGRVVVDVSGREAGGGGELGVGLGVLVFVGVVWAWGVYDVYVHGEAEEEEFVQIETEMIYRSQDSTAIVELELWLWGGRVLTAASFGIWQQNTRDTTFLRFCGQRFSRDPISTNTGLSLAPTPFFPFPFPSNPNPIPPALVVA